MKGGRGRWVLTTVGEIDDRNHAAREERVEFIVAALCFYHFELVFVLRVTSRGSSTSKVLWFLIGESNRTLAALVLAISLSQFDEGGLWVPERIRDPETRCTSSDG